VSLIQGAHRISQSRMWLTRTSTRADREEGRPAFVGAEGRGHGGKSEGANARCPLGFLWQSSGFDANRAQSGNVSATS